MKKELPKVYEPQQVEGRVYEMWENAGCFNGDPDPAKKPFSIVMPPPNVTGQLHMGHAMDCTLQDILTRFKRMQGYSTLWLPGVDHAGISTQVKVEEDLRVNEGLSRYDLGREKFLQRVWKWKEKYGNRIVQQQKKMGVSCDWSRSRFTMDEGLSKAVRETFCELYDKGLIYKGSRIINWCPHCVTALSDAEVEYQDKPGHLWHIRYPLTDGSGDLVVATTRPETMMGDTGVAVNPEDERFKHLVGKTCILPIMNREIPIVADEYVELGFGTGAVKMTPAHDPNDFEVGLRHNLEIIRCIGDDGKINENGGPYNGMDRYECRKAIVKDLEEQGYLVKTEPYSHNVGTCYRCHNDVEPLISAQWFVRCTRLPCRRQLCGCSRCACLLYRLLPHGFSRCPCPLYRLLPHGFSRCPCRLLPFCRHLPLCKIDHIPPRLFPLPGGLCRSRHLSYILRRSRLSLCEVRPIRLLPSCLPQLIPSLSLRLQSGQRRLFLPRPNRASFRHSAARHSISPVAPKNTSDSSISSDAKSSYPSCPQALSTSGCPGDSRPASAMPSAPSTSWSPAASSACRFMVLYCPTSMVLT